MCWVGVEKYVQEILKRKMPPRKAESDAPTPTLAVCDKSCGIYGNLVHVRYPVLIYIPLLNPNQCSGVPVPQVPHLD